MTDADVYRDYATWTHAQESVSSNAMLCDYKMVCMLDMKGISDSAD